MGFPECGIRTRRRSAGSRTSVFVSISPRQDAAAIDVEGGRKKRSSVKVGFLLLQAGFNFWLFRERSTRFALDDFCQHVDHRHPVFDDQGVGRFIGHDTAVSCPVKLASCVKGVFERFFTASLSITPEANSKRPNPKALIIFSKTSSMGLGAGSPILTGG